MTVARPRLRLLAVAKTAWAGKSSAEFQLTD